jgi:diadenosine tetraphosphate (Ap4A) HIT family hydrolase
MEPGCELCESAGGKVLWSDGFCRVVRVEDADYPGFCRVILEQHVKEMTDLPPAGRERLMRVVFAAEAALREISRPDKVNLASLGNVTAHLHWHVIPRWRDDRHFPAPIWAAAQAPPRSFQPPGFDAAAFARTMGHMLRS